MKIIDLTHTLHQNVPNWDGDCGFNISTEVDYKDCKEPDLFRVNRMEMRAGTGTHMDAPAHCIPGGRTVDKLEVKELVVDSVVIKIENADENYIVMPEKIIEFEKKYGEIKENTFVIFSTGWERFWEEKEKYRNNLKFPSIHENTAKLLLDRNISGIGVDTLSPDAGNNFPVHRVVLGGGRYIVENIANLDLMPSVGAKVCIMPLKIKDATESPIRIVAFV